MNKILLSSLLILGISTSVQAEDWTFFSDNNIEDKQYGLALIGGSLDLHQHDNSGSIHGLELSFIAPCVKASEHTIRQQVSLTKFDKGSMNIYSLEANPHYLYQVEEHTYLGVGPSLGLMKVEGDDVYASFGVGVSIRKDLTDNLFLGAEYRRNYATDNDYSNTRFMGKIGYFFNK